MGLVGAGYDEYEKDYVFATVQTINRDSHLMEYKPDDFDGIVLDEVSYSATVHIGSDSYITVREDLLRYLQSNILTPEENVG